MKHILVSYDNGQHWVPETCSPNSVAWLNIKRSATGIWTDPQLGYKYKRDLTDV